MSKADRAKKRKAKRKAGNVAVAARTENAHRSPDQAAQAPSKGRAVRPTVERLAHGEIQIPKGAGSQGQPAVVAVPDCIAALCIEPRKLTQGQENAARAYQELRARVLADMGIRAGRSCLDIGPVGHDDSDGDVE